MKEIKEQIQEDEKEEEHKHMEQRKNDIKVRHWGHPDPPYY